jgi:hypothetical protein
MDRNMQTVERFAFFFGLANLALGLMSFFSPFVAEKRSRNPIKRVMQRRNRGLFNTQTGQLLGMMGATNPPHAVLHSTLGAAGLATGRYPNLARPFMWVMGILFAAMAVIGWATTGTKPGIHHVKGVAVDWRDNVLHTVWGLSALALALRSSMRERSGYGENI